MCLGIKELLVEREFDKESGLGKIGFGDSGLGGSLKSELRGLKKELVEIFDSELRGWDEVVGKWRISAEKSAREARSVSTL